MERTYPKVEDEEDEGDDEGDDEDNEGDDDDGFGGNSTDVDDFVDDVDDDEYNMYTGIREMIVIMKTTTTETMVMSRNIEKIWNRPFCIERVEGRATFSSSSSSFSSFSSFKRGLME